MGKSLKYGEFTFSSDPVGGSKGYARGGKIQPGSPAANAGPGRVTNMGPGNMPRPVANPGPVRPNPGSMISPATGKPIGNRTGNLPPGNMPRPRVEVAATAQGRPTFGPDGRVIGREPVANPGPGGGRPMPQIQGGARGQKPSPEFLRRVSEEQQPVRDMRSPIMQRPTESPMPTQVAQKVGAAMKEAHSRAADLRNKIGQAMGTRASPMPGGPGNGRPMPPVSLPPPVPPKAPQMKSGGKVNIPAPKSGMLYSKKEVNAKNLLSEGKAPNLPHAKGSVNMKRGGMADCNMAKGGMTPKQQAKVGKVMGEFKAGELHSGSKAGPVVKSRKQAVAIGLSEARKAGKK